MGSHVAMNYAATIMGQHQEDVKNLEANGGHGEEIDGGKLRDVVLKKSTPGLRRQLVDTKHIFGHAAFPDVEAEFE